MKAIKKKNSYKKKEMPCDLRAQKDGIILSMIVRKGKAKKKIGENCSKNEILVSGKIPIINDSQEVMGYQTVQADADIEIQYKMEYYRSFREPIKR